MAVALVVRESFGYRMVGDVISDPVEMKTVLAGPEKRHVVKIGLPPAESAPIAQATETKGA